MFDMLVRVAVGVVREERPLPVDREPFARLMPLSVQQAGERPPGEPAAVEPVGDLPHVLRHPLPVRRRRVGGAGEHAQPPAAGAAQLERPARLVGQAGWRSRYQSARTMSSDGPANTGTSDFDRSVPALMSAIVWSFAGYVTTDTSYSFTSVMRRRL